VSFLTAPLINQLALSAWRTNDKKFISPDARKRHVTVAVQAEGRGTIAVHFMQQFIYIFNFLCCDKSSQL